jgi:hypothetical protein
VCIPFADAFQRLLTAHGKRPSLCVVCLPAISTFQRHSTQHLLHYRSPLSFHFWFRGVPFRICSTHCVWRLRLRPPTPGLVGSPHVHSSCLAPVSFAGMSPHLRLPAPQTFAQVLPTAGLSTVCKKLSQFFFKVKSGSPTGSRPRPFVWSPCYRPPRGGGSRSAPGKKKHGLTGVRTPTPGTSSVPTDWCMEWRVALSPCAACTATPCVPLEEFAAMQGYLRIT